MFDRYGLRPFLSPLDTVKRGKSASTFDIYMDKYIQTYRFSIGMLSREIQYFIYCIQYTIGLFDQAFVSMQQGNTPLSIVCVWPTHDDETHQKNIFGWTPGRSFT